MDKDFFHKKFSYVGLQLADIKDFISQESGKCFVAILCLMIFNAITVFCSVLIIHKDIKSIENELKISNSINLRK